MKILLSICFRRRKRKHIILLTLLNIPILLYGQYSNVINHYSKNSEETLADGKNFHFWSDKTNYTHTYYVDKNNPVASDSNSGSSSHPFKTISAVAKILRPGERVLIRGGIYREVIQPARGGEGPDKMISYEAFPGEEVMIKGSAELNPEHFSVSTHWIFTKHEAYTEDSVKQPVTIWEYSFNGAEFDGYNPFGMLNLLHDREYLQYQKVRMDPHFKRRGMLFLNGKALEQVLRPIDLAEKEHGAFWVEHNGMRIHVRFPLNSSPFDYTIEATVREQLFVPQKYGLGYIRISGITFSQCGNGFPVPQRGIISSSRGNHWMIEDCTIEWANSLGIDLGNEMWHTPFEPGLGYHIVRRNIIRNCGIGGLQALGANSLLVEDNLFENIGWQNAEQAWESGAIKFHKAVNTLIRRNIFRNIVFAPGIWLDYLSNKNCRITRNVFTDILSARGAIYIEVSRNHCLVDQNFFHKITCQYWISGEYGAGGSALYTDGSDSIEFRNNLIFDVENGGYTDYLNAERIVGTRGGLTRWHKVTDNIYVQCNKYAIEFANEYNFSDGNIFVSMPPGYLRIGNPAPTLMLDLESWQKAFGWEKRGMIINNLKIFFHPQNLELSFSCPNEVANLLIGKGPFQNYQSMNKVILDPRQLGRKKLVTYQVK